MSLARTLCTILRTAKGLAGSTGSRSKNSDAGRTHHLLRDQSVHGEDRPAGEQTADQERIQERGVVCHHHRRALTIAIMRAIVHPDAEGEPQQSPHGRSLSPPPGGSA